MRTVASLEADANKGRPGCWSWKGCHARLVIHFVWPFRGAPNASPVFAFQRRTVLSMLPVAKILPSGENETTSTQPV